MKQGKFMWKCKDVADTKKLLNGVTIVVEWNYDGKYWVKMTALGRTATDNDTLKVWPGDIAYYFTRITP